jgi:hypothetical protein
VDAERDLLDDARRERIAVTERLDARQYDLTPVALATHTHPRRIVPASPDPLLCARCRTTSMTFERTSPMVAWRALLALASRSAHH